MANKDMEPPPFIALNKHLATQSFKEIQKSLLSSLRAGTDSADVFKWAITYNRLDVIKELSKRDLICPLAMKSFDLPKLCKEKKYELVKFLISNVTEKIGTTKGDEEATSTIMPPMDLTDLYVRLIDLDTPEDHGILLFLLSNINGFEVYTFEEAIRKGKTDLSYKIFSILPDVSFISCTPTPGNVMHMFLERTMPSFNLISSKMGVDFSITEFINKDIELAGTISYDDETILISGLSRIFNKTKEAVRSLNKDRMATFNEIEASFTIVSLTDLKQHELKAIVPGDYADMCFTAAMKHDRMDILKHLHEKKVINLQSFSLYDFEFCCKNNKHDIVYFVLGEVLNLGYKTPITGEFRNNFYETPYGIANGVNEDSVLSSIEYLIESRDNKLLLFILSHFNNAETAMFTLHRYLKGGHFDLAIELFEKMPTELVDKDTPYKETILSDFSEKCEPSFETMKLHLSDKYVASTFSNFDEKISKEISFKKPSRLEGSSALLAS